MKNRVITDRDISKAFDELEEEAEILSKGAEEEELEEDDEIEKGSEEDEEEEDDDEVEKAEDDDDDDEDEDEEDEEDDDEDVEKAEEDEFEDEEDEEEEEEAPRKHRSAFATEKIQKATEVSPFLKGITQATIKSHQRIEKAIVNSIEILKSLDGRIAMLEDVDESRPRREVRSRITKAQVAKRFSKGVVDEEEDDDKVLSISKNKKDVLALMDAEAFEGNTVKEPDLAKAITTFEQTGSMSKDIAQRIEKRTGVKLVA